ncbi:pilus assembly protein N-terminal domain-containing protein [bacterium]|nr:pilus assembly protein N-terminal domain-containing protein [candidate division CSSED10-310 bacterium]
MLQKQRYYQIRTSIQYLALFLFFHYFISCSLLFSAQSKVEKVLVAKGQAELYDFKQAIKRVSVADPSIADVIVTTPSQVLINGKALGSTSLILWNEQEKFHQIRVYVHSEVATHQVMLQVRFAEINRNALKELGVDLLVKNMKVKGEQVDAGSFIGKAVTPHDPLNLGDNVNFFLSAPAKNITAMIKALEEKNLLSILAKPNLSAINGAEASFIAGGEFPIPIVSGTAGMQSITIQFKEFGVKLKFVPTVLDSELVNVKVAAEVSSLDFENGITLSGFRIPSLITRKAKTTVELQKGQYLVIGGLLSTEIIKTVSKIPVLGQIPILGKLFSSSRFINEETELIIMLSPEIIQAFEYDEIPEIDKL